MLTCATCGTPNPAHARFCLGCGAPIAEPGAPPLGSRRTVTVLFSDLVGSTALGERLDPELLRSVLAHYFAAMSSIIEAHGGTVEKYVGDAIMAVFGLTTIHEDDALRAARAALGMRERLKALNVDLAAERGITLAARTGIATGEVVTGDPATGGTLATGDAINTAARLEQAARPGEILLSATTLRLLRDTVITEPVGPISAKGKSAPVAASLLVSDTGPAPGRILRDAVGGPLFGRAAELEIIEQQFVSTTRARQAHLLMVVGPAGVGKSRLVTEALARLGGRATILRGRCLSYGEGITWWPLRGIIHAAADITEDDNAATARAKLGALVAGIRDGDTIASRLATAVGLSESAAPAEELLWAARRTIETLASERPVVLLVEDIHWAEAALLELLVQIAHVDTAPILVVCPARPELHEMAPGWGSDPSRFTWLELGALDRTASAALVDTVPGGSALPPVLRDRVLSIADGNPLFTEELVRMLVEDGLAAGSDIPLPPTIGALLAARLDALPASERGTAQRASVVGRAFETAAVMALTPQGSRSLVRESLAELARRELLVLDVAPVEHGPGVGDAYHFRHILIRDAAYERLTKTERADLHERFANWLEDLAGDRLVEYESILGHHLERAWAYQTELHDASPRTHTLGLRAGLYLARSGKRAFERDELVVAEAMLSRAEALPSRDVAARAGLLIDAGRVLLETGRGAEARDRADRALALSLEIGGLALASRARLLRKESSIAIGDLSEADPAAIAEVESALRDATMSGDALALALAWQARGFVSYIHARLADAAECHRMALRYARDAGDVRLAFDLEVTSLVHAFVGPTPATKVIDLARSLLEQTYAWPYFRADVLRLLGPAEAMLGRQADAEAHALESVATLHDLAQYGSLPNAESDLGGWVYRLGGRLADAEAALRRGHAAAEAIDDANQAAVVAGRIADLLIDERRFEDALPWLEEAERRPLALNRARILGMRAHIAAASGNPAAAELVATMLASVADTHFINSRTDALVDAAEVMAALGRVDEALEYATEALRLAEAKENLVLVAQITALIARFKT